MTDGDKRPEKSAARETREARLAAALRDNLRRRKAAVSGGSAAPADDSAADIREPAPGSD